MARLRPWLLPAVAFCVALVVVLVLWGKLRREVWAYYSDGADLRSEMDDAGARPVLWQDPEPHVFEDGDGAAEGTLEAAFSADGTMMVLVHWGPEGDNADLYRSDWDGRIWSKPEPISSINTKSAERSPALSRDGRYLYFASDRSGGEGGYDLYVARWDGVAWRGVEALSEIVNSTSNELGPALSADDGKLYFSSDRKGGADDIFVSEIKMPKAEKELAPKKEERKKDRKSRKKAAELAKAETTQRTSLAPVPRFGFPESVSDLNSEAADVQAALTTRGDHVFLASNRDGRGGSGFKIYLSRVVDGEALPPEEVQLDIARGDVTDPAVRMEGFDLLFSVGGKSGADPDYRLFRSTTREVVGYTDMSRWEQFKELMDDIKWWILLAIAALMALIYILEKWRDMTSLFHKCLAGSAVVHLLALLLAMVMLIATTIEEDEASDDNVVEVSIDALAQEELALESIPEETNLTEATTSLESEKEESEFGAPGFDAPQENQPVPEAAAPAKESAVVETQPAMAAASEETLTEPSEESTLLSDLAAAELPEIEPVELEERDPVESPPTANPAAEQFEPVDTLAESEKMETEVTEDRAVETPAEVAQVTENQPVEPLADQPKESEFVESSAAESEPVERDVTAEVPPLESEALSSLPDAQFVDPNETAFEESDAAAAQADSSPADPSQEVFEPGEAASSVAAEQATGGEATADSAADSSAGAGEVAESMLDAELASGSAVAAEFTESKSSEDLPAGDLVPALPDADLSEPGLPMLEEPIAEVASNPADEAADMFEPGGAASDLATEQVKGGAVTDVANTRQTNAADVAEGTLDAAAADDGAVSAEVAESDVETGLPSADLAAALPDAFAVDPGLPMLEEPDAVAGGPADESRDKFEPGGAASDLATEQAEGSTVADRAVSDDAAALPEAGMVADSAIGEVPVAQIAGEASEAIDVPSLAQGALPEAVPVDLGMPDLEEGARDAGGAVADMSKDQFKPGDAVPNLETNPAEVGVDSGAAVASATESGAVPTGGMVAGPAVTEARYAEAQASETNTELEPAGLKDLPVVMVVDPGLPTLEEPGGGGGVADEDAEQFKPGSVVPGLVTRQTGGGAVADVAVDQASGGGAVAAARPDASLSAATNGSALAAMGALPDLTGGGVAAGLETPGAMPSPMLPGELEAPPGVGPRGMAEIIRKQRGKPGMDTIEQMGGSKGSEEAVGAAVEWLSKNQEKDGRWDTRKHGAKQNFDAGGTGLALLCFYGWGERHDVKCRYQDNVRRAIDWLVAQQDENGFLGEGPGMMYSHAISAIALCEAYGVTKDPKLRKPAERAITYTLASQHPTLGGWRYTPGNGADTSVTGWQYMALHSARMAGLKVPEEAFEKARGFLEKTGGGRNGGLYGYQGRTDISRAMVATGMFCRQLDLVPPSDPKMRESARFLKMNPMKTSKPDLYYVYYATLALYQHQGPVWMAWNERLQETLKVLQRKNGALAGSWDPSASMTGDGGRVISTSLATLSLEVYYRLLPMYGFRNTEAEVPEPKVRGEGR